MTEVMNALDNSKNALLESPTGTGKTLCLLTASLAWLRKERARLKASGSSDKNMPRIIYASRTHSQLSQVQEELKGCAYKPRVVLQASRDQLCINDKVLYKNGDQTNDPKKKLRGNALSLAC